ncbi:peptide-binding protein [Flagellimonas eckloniae]|uniref:peptide-binding protein n=1 Tax=Flagellimonas eckloniae TaxID=346185 RepID=UPI000A9841CE|nr:peptide-binding protein [Allomuricauda eckloniae]
MKFKINIAFGLLILAFLSCNQKKSELYVSVNGDDTAVGTKEQPIRTIERAKDMASSLKGKVDIVLQDGTHYLSKPLIFEANDSGTEKYPVTYRAANDGKAIISGGSLLELQWEPFRDGIYKASVSADIKEIDQLYVNGINQRMARFPNAIEGKNVFDTWDLHHTKKPDPENDPLETERIASWSDPTGAYLHAMHAALWGDMHWLVKGRKDDGSLDLEGGWQNNRPSPMHPRYRIVENVFEELDAPHEWYFNKEERTLYYYPEVDIDLQNSKIEVVRLKNLVEFRGTKENPVRFINFEGLVFRHAARSFMENKEQLLRSDWTTYRGGAVKYNGAEDCMILDCEFDQLGGNSIFVNNYNRRLTFKSCYIHHSGASGIAFVGDPAMVRSPLFRYGPQDYESMDRTPGPKGDNYPEDCSVIDCLITMTGRFEKQTSPVQISMSSRITVNHCSIYDVPRAGINISEGTFGGHIIEYCDVFNTVLETGDHGSFNSWGRDRFWTPDIVETAAQVSKDSTLPFLDILEPNIIRNSRWRCDHGWDIDLDDGSSHYRIYNNLLLNRGLKMREGYDRIAYNNIIINNSLHPHVWYPKSGDVFKNNIVSAAYKPAIMNRGIVENGKWGKQIDSNLFITNEADKTKFLQNQTDVNSIVGNPMFYDGKNGDFRVKEQSPALKMGFKNFPMDEFGVISEKLRKIAKQPKIPEVMAMDLNQENEVFELYMCKVKNVKTMEERSAAGLSATQGVMFISIPGYSNPGRSGFKTGDVIVSYGDILIRDFKHLQTIIKENQAAKELTFGVMQNQEKVLIKLEL